MSKTDTSSQVLPISERSRSPYSLMAAHIEHLGRGPVATLRGIDPDVLRPHQLGALTNALMAAGLEPERWQPETWRQWAAIVAGIAYAGHSATEGLGVQLARAGVTESRVNRLLSSRGDALLQGVPALVRMMASTGQAPNWNDLGALVLSDSGADKSQVEARKADAIRLRIAAGFFSELRQKQAAKG